MGKGLNRARNKQGELARKLALAKQQNKKKTSSSDDGEGEKSQKDMTDEEIKEKNDRLRFAEMLKNQGSMVLNDYSTDGYLNKQQEEEEIIAARSGRDRIFEGDPAPEEPFEGLVSPKSGNAIAERGAERLVPWLSSTPSPNDFLIILCDPRDQSDELRQTLKNLVGELPSSLLAKMIVINGDTPAENRRFLKKSGLKIVDLYSDEKLEWMREYTALGDTRWSMTMFILSDRRVVKLVRELDQYAASRVIQNAVRSLN